MTCYLSLVNVLSNCYNFKIFASYCSLQQEQQQQETHKQTLFALQAQK